MTYLIASSRLGTIGDVFQPADGVNIEALLAGGFIVQQSTPKATKPAKTITEPNEEN